MQGYRSRAASSSGENIASLNRKRRSVELIAVISSSRTSSFGLEGGGLDLPEDAA